MIFRKRRTREEEPLEITLKNHKIPQRESTQFLGMTLYSKQNWEEHTEKTSANAKRALNIIKIVAGKKWGADRKTLKNCTVTYVDQKQTTDVNYMAQPPQAD